MAAPKSRSWRSKGASEMAMGSEAPEAPGPARGGGSPRAFSTSQVVSLSPQDGADDVFGFDAVGGADLPLSGDAADGASQPKQEIDLVDGLGNEGAAALGGPSAFDGARVVFIGAIPLHVSIGLKDFAQAAGGNGRFQELE